MDLLRMLIVIPVTREGERGDRESLSPEPQSMMEAGDSSLAAKVTGYCGLVVNQVVAQPLHSLCSRSRLTPGSVS